MADWSELPKELLRLISSRLDSPFYLVRFRSVCSSWRSSSTPLPNHHQFPLRFPLFFPRPPTTTSVFSLSKRSLFLITPPRHHHHHHHPPQTPRPWLIKLGQDPSGRTLLFHPLSRSTIRPALPPSPHLLDFLHLPVLEIGHEFILADSSPGSHNALYMEKVVFSWLGPQKDGFALLTIHISGRLALFRSGQPDWTIIPEMPTPYDDVCVHKGSLFAVDHTGRTVTVGLDSSLSLAADAVFGGDKKFLVVCDGGLYLVDKHLYTDYEFPPEDDIEVYNVPCETAVKFDVYWLEEEEGRWVEVASLGDSVLFLGDDFTFSASASELGVDRGDCVVFRDDTLNVDGQECPLGVFRLDEGTISPLSDYPSFSGLFWPPPDWVGLH